VAEVTGAQIDALTKALEKLEGKLASGGSSTSTLGLANKNDGGVTKNLKDLAGGVATGTAKIRDFGKAIPLGMLGTFGNTLTNAGLAIIDYVVGTKQEFEGLAKVGAGLTGDLGELQMTAAETRMSLPQFAKMVKNNSTLLSQFGGGMTDSVKKFGALSDAMFKGEQAPINTFMRLGMTIEESNEFMLQALAVNQRSARFRQMEEIDQLRAAEEYAKNLNIISKLTGKNAKEIQKEADARMNEGDINATLRLREREGAKGSTEAFQAIQGDLALLPAATQKLLKQTFNLGGPIDEQTSYYASLNPKTAALVKQMDQINADTSLSAKERKKRSVELMKEITAAAAMEADSTQNLRIARTAAVTDAGAIAASSIQEMDKLINAIGQHADDLGIKLGETGGYFKVFNSLMTDLQTEQNKQLSDSESSTAAMRAVTESQQAIANASSAVRGAMGQQLQDNKTITEALDTVADTLDKAKLATKFENLSEALGKINTRINQIAEAETVGLPPTATEEEITQKQNELANQYQGEVDKGDNFFERVAKGIMNYFKDDDEPDGRKTGGGMTAGGLYNYNEAQQPLSGEIIKATGSETMLSAEQSNNLITQAVSQSSKDFGKLNETMTAVSDKLDVMIAINTTQNRNQKQTIDAIHAKGNMLRGIGA
tara:strand:- start:662 stop:2632 length:1971 start_codon:yes stop_codon:yes gene_type:complete